jgi:hypothetical protein
MVNHSKFSDRLKTAFPVLKCVIELLWILLIAYYFASVECESELSQDTMTARVAAILSVVVLTVLLNPSCAVLKDYRFLSKNITSTLDQLLDRSRYDKRIRPDFGGKFLLLIMETFYSMVTT